MNATGYPYFVCKRTAGGRTEWMRDYGWSDDILDAFEFLDLEEANAKAAMHEDTYVLQLQASVG